MDAYEIDWRRRVNLKPFGSMRSPGLGGKVVSCITLRFKDHVFSPLRSDIGIELLKGNRTVERAAPDSVVIRNRTDVVMLGVSGSDRLGREVIGIYEVCVLGAEVKCRVDDLPVGQDVVEL